MKVPSNRRGFVIKAEQLTVQPYVSIIPEYLPPIVYYSHKLTHNGIVSYKTFENSFRRIHVNSMSNLLTYSGLSLNLTDDFVERYKKAISDVERSRINDQAIAELDQEEWERFLSKTRQQRHLNPAQSRKIRSLCDKLAYYSANRTFKSKRTGTYTMRLAFLTLTAPESATPAQSLSAFATFIDYIARTANCNYVWKKELGEKHQQLHFHVVVNNFIPYYLVAWKWKRALIAQGVKWPKNEKGVDSSSHYRIELPRSRKAVSHYISKYMSKAFDLPGEYGYISGFSKAISQLKEIVLTDHDIPQFELDSLVNSSKFIRTDFVSLLLTDLLKVKDIAPSVYSLFYEQYQRFSEALTLPQKFSII